MLCPHSTQQFILSLQANKISVNNTSIYTKKQHTVYDEHLLTVQYYMRLVLWQIKRPRACGL